MGSHHIIGDPTLSVTDTLLMIVTDVFAEMSALPARIDTTGGDHVVLVLGERFAFRFPRHGMHGLDLELKLMRELRTRSSIPMPEYKYVDPGRRFAGYELIKGTALDPATLRSLDVPTRKSLVDKLVRFLLALHETRPETVAPRNHWPVSWNAQAFADRIASERLATIIHRFPHLQYPIAAFLARYPLHVPHAMVVVHGDLVPEHLLFDDTKRELAGIIDFSDAALGDHAQDFLGLWTYGTEFVKDVIASYDPEKRDPDLLDRSRNHFVRYRIDQLFELISDEAATEDIARHAAELSSLMSD